MIMKKCKLLIIILILGITFIITACSGNSAALGISSIAKTNTNDLVDTYTITYTDGSTTTFTVTNGANGLQGIQGEKGEDGHSPIITIGENGNWFIDGIDSNHKAEGLKGDTGNGIASVEKTASDGLKDTYTITFTDGSTTTFVVTNGSNGIQGIQGEKGEDGHSPIITIGDNGHWFIDGVDTTKPAGIKGDTGNGIASIKKTASDGLKDTYTITFTDGSTTTFVVTNGAEGSQGIQGEKGEDGHTPIITIGENGNWFIDGVDTTKPAQGFNAPHYGEKLTVTYHLDGGTLPLGYEETITVSWGDTLDLPIPIKDGYEFIGWFTGNTVNDSQFYLKDAVFKDLDLYARFHTDGIEVKLTSSDINLGSVSQNGSGLYEEGETIEVYATPINNSVFVGWYDEHGNLVSINSTYSFKMPNQVVYLEAVFTSSIEGDQIINGIIYKDLGDHFSVSGYSDTISSQIIIKSVINNKKVIKIESNAFLECDSIAEVTIPSSITEIGNAAFANCRNLENIHFLDGLEIIGDNAFTECDSLQNVAFPTTLTKIGSSAFENCSQLTKLLLPASLTTLANSAFANCSNLESIIVDQNNPFYDSRNNSNAIIETSTNTLILGCKSTIIPSNIVNIGYAAFKACDGLTSIEIPNSVTNIGDYAFADCTNLISVTLNEGLSSIGANTFSRCTNLYNITIPSTVINIGESAFSYCYSIESILLPSNLTIISANTFSYCNGLKSITLPEGLVVINSYAFEYCTNLNEINLPSTITTIASFAFRECKNLSSLLIPASVSFIDNTALYNCRNLENLNVAAENEIYDSRDNSNAIIMSETNTLIIGCKNTIIVETVTAIGNQAFYGCSELTNINIPSSVTSLGEYSFANCNNITNITLPNSITSIGDSTFSGCNSLINITIPSSVRYLGKNTFMYCSALKFVTIAEGISSIKASTFSYCESLTTITIPKSVTLIESGAFSNCPRITYVNYCGSEAEWEKITIDENNTNLTTNTIINYNYNL